MSWRDNLRPGSFRGVRFHTEERQLSGGRRIQNHEFPKRNSNFPEDMGKATRGFSVDAYYVGDDYMSRRNRLIQACEQEGPGSYVDHWNVSQRVVLENFEVIETSEEGRFCRVRMQFLEAGGEAGPTAIIATAAQLATSATNLIQSAVTHFNGTYSR